MASVSKPLVLVISQVYVPDPASVGQHLADVAETMARRGYDVRVLTSRRGYEDPSVKYAARERRGSVDIVRLPWSSFGKRTLLHRLVGQGFFLTQAIVRGVFSRRLGKILVSTSPPMGACAALAISLLRRVPICYWVMDFNPDQAIALRRVKPNGWLVRAMKWLNRRVFSRAAQVIVLDRFMAERIRSQYRVDGRLEVLPPWPHVDFQQAEEGANPFREKYNPTNKFVVMYSGNHSTASPVSTLVQAALRLRDNPRLLFLFVGGGDGKREVDAAIAVHRPANVLSLPYQPLEQLRYSLPTADVHVVTLGNEMVGIIHPCKIYGAMAVGRPVLLIGPAPSHAADLLERHACGWRVNHGDVDGVIARLQEAIAMSPETRDAMGRCAADAVRAAYARERLCGTVCDLVELGMAGGSVSQRGRDEAATTAGEDGSAAEPLVGPIYR